MKSLFFILILSALSLNTFAGGDKGNGLDRKIEVSVEELDRLLETSFYVKETFLKSLIAYPATNPNDHRLKIVTKLVADLIVIEEWDLVGDVSFDNKDFRVAFADPNSLFWEITRDLVIKKSGEGLWKIFISKFEKNK